MDIVETTVKLIKAEREIKSLKDTIQQFHDRYMESCKKRDNLKQIIKQVKDKAEMWDGNESSYYGNKLKKILENNDNRIRM